MIISWIKIGGIILIPVILLLLPADFFDKGDSICLSHVLFDRDCYGCGMTRAIQHLIHLDFKEAWEFNKISFLVMPLFSLLGIQEIRKHLLRIKKENLIKD